MGSENVKLSLSTGKECKNFAFRSPPQILKEFTYFTIEIPCSETLEKVLPWMC